MEHKNKNQIGRTAYNEETFRLRVMDLHADASIGKESALGDELDWYGNRLYLLRLFYHKTANEIALYLKVSGSTVNNWEKNKKKPDFKYIETLALLFEVDTTFFTLRETELKIKKQLKIEQL